MALFFLFKNLLKDIYFQREGKGGRKGEKHQCVSDPSIGHLSHTRNQGPGPRPRNVPWRTQTSSVLVRRLVLNPLSISQGWYFSLRKAKLPMQSMIPLWTELWSLFCGVREFTKLSVGKDKNVLCLGTIPICPMLLTCYFRTPLLQSHSLPDYWSSWQPQLTSIHKGLHTRINTSYSSLSLKTTLWSRY